MYFHQMRVGFFWVYNSVEGFTRKKIERHRRNSVTTSLKVACVLFLLTLQRPFLESGGQ